MGNEIIKKCNPCQFYGFFIDVSDLLAPANIYCGHKNHLWINPIDEPNNVYCSFCKMPYSIFESGTVDINHEDLTNQKLIENI